MKNKLISRKSIFFISIIYFAFNICFLAISQHNNNEHNTKTKQLRYVENNAFGYGEKLDYKVGYKFITAGYGSFRIMPEPVYRFNRECYDIRFEVQSLKSLEFLYKVRNKYSTILDVVSIIPWEFEQHQREGGYKKDFKAWFDQSNNLAYVGKEKYWVPDNIHDIVSAFFYVRTLNLSSMKNGSVFYLKNFYEDTTYNLGVRIVKRETIEVEAGTFKCIVVEPLVVEGGLFKSDGNIFIWLTDDERKMPVKVGTKILIGYVGAELIKYSGLRGPVTARIK